MSLASLLKDMADVSVDVQVSSITLDSQQVEEGSLFIALRGTVRHGIEFAAAAARQGAAAVVWEADENYQAPVLGIPCVEIDNLRAKTGTIANRFYGQPSEQLQVIGVTGTDGKTTVTNFIAQALNQQQPQCHIIGTLGQGVPGALRDTGHTTPDVVSVHQILGEMREQGAASVAMEVSSHALDQGRVLGVAFDIAVLTNLSRDHLDYHGTVEAYAAAKARLFGWPGLKSLVLNLDDPFGQQLAAEYASQSVQLINYCVGDTTELPAEYLVGHNPNYTQQGIRAEVHYQNQQAELQASVIGSFNLHNLLAAIGVLLASDYSLAQAVAMVSQVSTVSGRMEMIGNNRDLLVVVDYAHTPMALEQAIQALKHHTGGKLITVFGCGGDRDRGKRPKMAEVAERLSDSVIMTDDNPRSEMPFQIMDDMIKGLQNPLDVAVVHNRRQAIRHALMVAEPGDTVLIAGKGHETVQIIGEERLPFDDREQARDILAEVAA